jgi:hypothetical protein
MWLFTKIGFFSGTLANFESKSYADMPRPSDWQTTPYIMVRGRVRDDLVRLVEFNTARGGSAPAIFSLPNHDYPYRVLMNKDEWVMLVAALVADVDYSNFKNAVTSNARTREEGDARHDLYLDVWRVLYGAERWLQDRVKRARDRAKANKRQGSLGFWMTPQRSRSDPRSDADMQALYGSRGWQEWLDEDEEAAIVSDLPEGTHEIIDVLDDVIDNPTPDDIARFEAALSRPTPRRRRGKRR